MALCRTGKESAPDWGIAGVPRTQSPDMINNPASTIRGNLSLLMSDRLEADRVEHLRAMPLP